MNSMVLKKFKTIVLFNLLSARHIRRNVSEVHVVITQHCTCLKQPLTMTAATTTSRLTRPKNEPRSNVARS